MPILKTLEDLDLFKDIKSFNHTENSLGNKYTKAILRQNAINIIKELQKYTKEVDKDESGDIDCLAWIGLCLTHQEFIHDSSDKKHEACEVIEFYNAYSGYNEFEPAIKILMWLHNITEKDLKESKG